MNCAIVSERLPDYLQHALPAESAAEVEAHLAACAECRQQVALWTSLGELPQEQPSPIMRTRFEAMLAGYRQAQVEVLPGTKARSWGGFFRMPAFQFAAALLLVIGGFVAGRVSNRGNQQDLASLHQELRSTREMVALSLLQQESASERLRGINYTQRVDRPNSEVMAALIRALRYDSSVDVRLAALDALQHYDSRPDVRSQMVQSLGAQQSPLVQIALIDRLVELHDQQAVQALQKLQSNPKLHPAVKQRAEWGVTQLTRG